VLFSKDPYLPAKTNLVSLNTILSYYSTLDNDAADTAALNNGIHSTCSDKHCGCNNLNI
jgi:hypothetical protein